MNPAEFDAESNAERCDVCHRSELREVESFLGIRQAESRQKHQTDVHHHFASDSKSMPKVRPVNYMVHWREKSEG